MSVVDAEGVEWVRAGEASSRLPGVSREVVWAWAERGRVQSIRVGREVWVSWSGCLEQEQKTRRFRQNGDKQTSRV